MTASEWLATAWLLVVVGGLLTVLLITLALDNRRKRRGQEYVRRPMSPTEFYAQSQARKYEALRHLRAVARQHRRPADRQRRNPINTTPWR